MFDKLPPRIRSKITIDEHNHWVWTGYVLPAKEVTRQNILTGSFDNPNAKLFKTYTSPPVPRASYDGSSRPAIRVILTHTLDMPYIKVPSAKRQCTHPLCVNPDHYRLPTPDILALLLKAEPLIELGPESAAEEIGVPSIPEPIWAQYLKECPDA